MLDGWCDMCYVYMRYENTGAFDSLPLRAVFDFIGPFYIPFFLYCLCSMLQSLRRRYYIGVFCNKTV